jgi:DNA-binding CsgD family transcriptional regulator
MRYQTVVWLNQELEALQQHRSSFSSCVSDLVLDGYLQRHRLVPPIVTHPNCPPVDRELVQLVSEGRTSKEVATTLGMILKTAERHRSNVMLKLKLHSTVELVLYAVRNKNGARATAFLCAARSSKWKRTGARCPSGAQLRIVSASVRWNLSENSHQQGRRI